jgi:catechol 2,3-dioxygenase-like lactoylglutathione lyase family enzyme
MLYRFDHQHLVVDNVEETATFYEKYFGAKRTATTAINGVPVVRLDLQGTPIVVSGPLIPDIGDHYGVIVANLEQAIQELKAQGVSFLTEPTTWGTVSFIFVKDPAGNAVEIVQRGS